MKNEDAFQNFINQVFLQADFFTEWLSYLSLIAKKNRKLNSMGRSPKIDHAHFRITHTGEF